jgi:hypothetical protein
MLTILRETTLKPLLLRRLIVSSLEGISSSVESRFEFSAAF